MATDAFCCDFMLRPVYWDRCPQVSVKFDHEEIWTGALPKDLNLTIERELPRGAHTLQLEFFGKLNSDSQGDQDQAVIIEKLAFHGIGDDRFKWQGIYCPEYPEPWRSQQAAQGLVLPKLRLAHDYLGWNGVWCLAFTTPIFTWMHRVQDLGWIYP